MCHATAEGVWNDPDGLDETDVSIQGPGGDLPGLYVWPEGQLTSSPAVLLVPDIFGRCDFYERLARRLAGEGYAVLLPDYFHTAGRLEHRGVSAARDRRRRLDENLALAELNTAVAWLRGSGARRVATVGFCLGGTMVLRLAWEDDALPTVCYYGFPGASPRAGHQSVTPPLEMSSPLASPVLGLWGSDDSGVGMENVRRLQRRAERDGSELDVMIYPGVGHGFLRHLNSDPGHDAYDAATDSWCRVRTFLAEHLNMEMS